MHLAAKLFFGVSQDVEVRFQLGHSHLKAVLRWTSKRAHSHGLQLLMAVGLELRWSCQPERLHMAFLAWPFRLGRIVTRWLLPPEWASQKYQAGAFWCFLTYLYKSKWFPLYSLDQNSHKPSQIQRKKVYIYQWEQQQSHMWNRIYHFGN